MLLLPDNALSDRLGDVCSRATAMDRPKSKPEPEQQILEEDIG